MSTIAYSPKESSRFQMNIYRGLVEHIDARVLRDIIVKNMVDILILRIPSENLAEQDKLERLGFEFLCADTLVYYIADLQANKETALKNNDLQFYVITDKDFETVDNMVKIIFAGYTNHYNSNNYLDKENILAGYQEWVRDFTSKGEEGNCISWLVKRGNELVGFATCSYDGKLQVCEGVLYGVLPNESGKGIYGDLIRFTKNYFTRNGYKNMKVSTQIQNFAVQKVWTREGFVLDKSYNTFHINSLLNYSKRPVDVYKFVISADDVQKIAETTGDFNPIHFDDDFAMKNKLKGRIAHGIIANAELTKYYGMEYPGNGTIFMKYNYIFLLPLYLNEDYKFRISFPLVNTESGIHKSVAIVTDNRNNICLISYVNLLKRN